MPEVKKIKSRIASVQEMQKITNAMYLIASTKVQRAKRELDRTKPYFEAIRVEIKRIFRTLADVESPYFYPPSGEHDLPGAYGFLVITADKGLAGAYNQNVLKLAEELMRQHPDPRLFVVGEYGRQYFRRRNIPIEKSFLYTAQNPTLYRATEISDQLLELYQKEKLSKIYVVYTDFENSMSEPVRVMRLLPFHRADFETTTEEKAVLEPFDFDPSVAQVLNNIVPTYVTGFIYSALVDSFCSEQSARMTAMDSANRNAKELLSQLRMTYNHLRQAMITQEITEISSGARALKKSKTHKQAGDQS